MRLSNEYIAAFLDCDGCVSIVRAKPRNPNHRGVFYPRVGFYSQNLSVLEEIREVVGGKVSPKITTLNCFALQLAPKATASCLRSLAPYLRIKKEQALLALHFFDLRESRRRMARKHGLPEEIHQEYVEIYTRMCELNHRDSQAFRTNPVNSGDTSKGEAILSEAAEGEGSADRATTRSASPNNNPTQERRTRKGRDSLSNADSQAIH